MRVEWNNPTGQAIPKKECCRCGVETPKHSRIENQLCAKKNELNTGEMIKRIINTSGIKTWGEMQSHIFLIKTKFVCHIHKLYHLILHFLGVIDQCFFLWKKMHLSVCLRVTSIRC